MPKRLLALVTALCLAVLGACGDDDGGSGDTTGTTATPPTGEPIKIMTLGAFQTTAGTSNPEWPAAVQARAAAVNRAGGIQGRPLHVIECNTGIDPNKQQQCARQAVDEKVVAVIGTQATQGQAVYPILAEAGIASIGTTVFDQESGNSPISFPVDPDGFGAFAGMPRVLADKGAKKIALLYPQLGSLSAGLKVLFDKGASLTDATVTHAIAVPPDAADLTPFITSALADGTDGIAGALLGEANGRLLKALSQQAPDLPVATWETFLPEKLIKELGPAVEGVYVVGSTISPLSDSKGSKMFRADMKAHNPSLSLSTGAQIRWVSTWVFERVAKGISGEITATSVLDATGRIEDMDMGGITPPFTTTKTVDVLPFVKRNFNPFVVYQQVKDGKLTELDKADPFSNPFER